MHLKMIKKQKIDDMAHYKKKWTI